MSSNTQVSIMTFNCFPDWAYIIVYLSFSRKKENKNTEERIKHFRTMFEKMNYSIYCFQVY